MLMNELDNHTITDPVRMEHPEMTPTAQRPYRGVFPVAPTIFDDRGELDLAGQRRCIDFMIDAGSNGLCILANFSEQFVLTDAEREQVFQALSEKGEKEFLSVLSKQPTLGYIWTSESAGYSVRYAYQTTTPDGGERVIVATDKPLGSWNPQIWKAAGTATASPYEFTVIELRFNRRRGTGEGKSSLFAKVTADKATKTIALENYAAAKVVLKDVKAPQKTGAVPVRTGKPTGR